MYYLGLTFERTGEDPVRTDRLRTFESIKEMNGFLRELFSDGLICRFCRANGQPAARELEKTGAELIRLTNTSKSVKRLAGRSYSFGNEKLTVFACAGAEDARKQIYGHLGGMAVNLGCGANDPVFILAEDLLRPEAGPMYEEELADLAAVLDARLENR